MNDKKDVQRVLSEVISSPHKVVTEDVAKKILADYRLQVPPYVIVNSSRQAAQESAAMGFPLVAKVVSPMILHKTDVQGVKVGLNSESEVVNAFDDMYGRLRNDFDVRGILLEKMVPSGVELIVGLQNDPQFGPVIMCGLGGVYTELFKDVSFRVLPIDKSDALKMLEGLKGRQILHGFRGSRPVDVEMVAEALVKIGNLGIDMAPFFESVDFNPMTVYPDSYFIVDAKILLKDKPNVNAISKAQPNSNFMDIFFNAKSIALVGASPEKGKIGNSVLESLSKHEFKGKIFPINAKGYPDIMGLKAYKSLDDVQESIDLVIVTVDLKFVPALLKSCGNKGIHNMVIISGGGKELGGERAEIEQEIKKLSQELGIRIIGPNCIGVFNGENRLDCAFQGHARMVRPKNGKVSFLSQSGTVGIAFMETSDTFGTSKMISYGNRSDVDEADMIWYLAQDPNTDVIGLYVEGLGDGRKFIDTAKRVISEHKKPVVVFKNGRTTRGAVQAASHTGSLGGSFGVVKGAFEQSGIISVDSYEELTGSLKALTWQPAPSGNKVAMVTNGAGPIIAAIDRFEDLGLKLANLSQETLNSFKEHYPATYVLGNPLDVTGSASADDYKFAIQAFMDDPNVDIIMPWFVFQDDPLEEKIVDVLAEFQNLKLKPILVGAMGGPFTRKIAAEIESKNIPVYDFVSTWSTAAGTLAKWQVVRAS
jgi:3-hydroxypropionyl-CoA synthetase (ADP-forming)